MTFPILHTGTNLSCIPVAPVHTLALLFSLYLQPKLYGVLGAVDPDSVQSVCRNQKSFSYLVSWFQAADTSIELKKKRRKFWSVLILL